MKSAIGLVNPVLCANPQVSHDITVRFGASQDETQC